MCSCVHLSGLNVMYVHACMHDCQGLCYVLTHVLVHSEVRSSKMVRHGMETGGAKSWDKKLTKKFNSACVAAHWAYR